MIHGVPSVRITLVLRVEEEVRHRFVSVSYVLSTEMNMRLTAVDQEVVYILKPSDGLFLV